MRGFGRFGSPGCCYERERERLERETEGVTRERGERDRGVQRRIWLRERFGSETDSVHPAERVREIRFTRLLLRNRD